MRDVEIDARRGVGELGTTAHATAKRDVGSVDAEGAPQHSAQRGTPGHPPLAKRSRAEAPGTGQFRRGKERRRLRQILGRALELAPPEGDSGGDWRECAGGDIHRFRHENGRLAGPSYWVVGCAATVHGRLAAWLPAPSRILARPARRSPSNVLRFLLLSVWISRRNGLAQPIFFWRNPFAWR